MSINTSPVKKQKMIVEHVISDIPATKLAPTNTGEGSGEPFSFTELLTLEELRKKQMHFIKERNWDQFHAPRNVLLALVGEVGELSEVFQWKGEVSEGLLELSAKERTHVGEELSDVLLYLVDLSHQCRIDLPITVQNKMAHNGCNNPVEKACGNSIQYTDFQSGVPTDTNPSSTCSNDTAVEKDSGKEFSFTDLITFEELRKNLMAFIKEQKWDQFETPRNVLLALVSEVGEVCEIFQWKGEVSQGLPELSAKERTRVGEKLSGVLLYLLDLSHRCRIDLPVVVQDKMTANGRKYSVEKSYGKSNKYTDYQ